MFICSDLPFASGFGMTVPGGALRTIRLKIIRFSYQEIKNLVVDRVGKGIDTFSPPTYEPKSVKLCI
jgi:hypothetical protein